MVFGNGREASVLLFTYPITAYNWLVVQINLSSSWWREEIELGGDVRGCGEFDPGGNWLGMRDTVYVLKCKIGDVDATRDNTGIMPKTPSSVRKCQCLVHFL